MFGTGDSVVSIIFTGEKRLRQRSQTESLLSELQETIERRAQWGLNLRYCYLCFWFYYIALSMTSHNFQSFYLNCKEGSSSDKLWSYDSINATNFPWMPRRNGSRIVFWFIIIILMFYYNIQIKCVSYIYIESIPCTWNFDCSHKTRIVDFCCSRSTLF